MECSQCREESGPLWICSKLAPCADAAMTPVILRGIGCKVVGYTGNTRRQIQHDRDFNRCVAVLAREDSCKFFSRSLLSRRHCGKYTYDDRRVLPDRLGRRFAAPQNCVKVAIKVTNFNLCKDWPVAYHGTSLANLAASDSSILVNGFDLRVAERFGHGSGLYLTPSWSLAHYIAQNSVCATVDSVTTARVILEVRVRLGKFDRRRNTFRNEEHPNLPCLEWPDSDIEWIVLEPENNVVITGLLMCLDDSSPHDGMRA